MLIVLIASVAAYAVVSEGQQEALPLSAEAAEPAEAAAGSISVKAVSAAITMGLGAAAGAIAMAFAISKSSESISRQPEAESGIRAALILGLVFIETAIIYALVVAIMIIFVL